MTTSRQYGMVVVPIVSHRATEFECKVAERRHAVDVVVCVHT